MQTFPTIETERLRLSALQVEDIPTIVQHAAHPDIHANTLNIPYPYEALDAIRWINMAYEGKKKGTDLILAIRNKTTDSLMGGIGLVFNERSNRAEVGYWLGATFWNKGYMSEAAIALMEYAFDRLALNKITSHHFDYNPASGKVMQKMGMQQEGVCVDHILAHEKYHTIILYGITKSQFQEQRRAV